MKKKISTQQFVTKSENMKFINFPNLVAFDDVRKKVSSARRKETWARVNTAPTHRATTAPDLERLCLNRYIKLIATSRDSFKQYVVFILFVRDKWGNRKY